MWNSDGSWPSETGSRKAGSGNNTTRGTMQPVPSSWHTSRCSDSGEPPGGSCGPFRRAGVPLDFGIHRCHPQPQSALWDEWLHTGDVHMIAVVRKYDQPITGKTHDPGTGSRNRDSSPN